MPLEAIVPAPYSQDLRQRVIGFMALGGSARAAAMRFDVSVSSAIRWAQRWRAEGHARPRAMGGDRRSRLGEHRARVLQLIAGSPTLPAGNPRRTRGLVRDHGRAEYGAPVSWCPQPNAQKKTLHAAEQDRSDVAEARRVFIRRQPALDPNRLVFIDETWAATNMTRRYGRCARGLRLWASVPHGHWKQTTLVAGLRTAGISAPYVFEGAINGERFALTSSRCWRQHWRPATLSCSIICAAISRRHCRGDRRQRGATHLSTALQPRSEPDRTGFRQIQGAAAQGRGAHRREPVADHRPHRRPLLASRMPQLL